MATIREGTSARSRAAAMVASSAVIGGQLSNARLGWPGWPGRPAIMVAPCAAP